MLRHEQQLIAMALAAALHHSAGPWEKKVEMQQNAALRGQTTGTRAREEVVIATHDALRGQKHTTPPGRLRRSAGDTHPTLGLPVLAGASAEVVDASTLAFLTRAVLEEKRKDEVEKATKEKVKEGAAKAAGAASGARGASGPS